MTNSRAIECLKSLTDTDIQHAWDAGNDAGQGFPVGENTDSPREALGRDGYEWITDYHTRSGARCAAGVKGGRIVAVLDINGPWAVNITSAETLDSWGNP